MGEISARLVRDGHQVTVATTDAADFELFWDPAASRLSVREEWHDGVQILRFRVRHVPLATYAYPGLRRLLLILSKFSLIPLEALYRVARLTPWVPGLRQWLFRTAEEYDLVAGMTICFEGLIEAGLQFATDRGIPFVIYPLTHLGAGSVPGQDALARFYTMRHQIELVRRSSAVVAQTTGERDFYVRLGVSPARIAVVGPGFNVRDVLGGNAARLRQRYGLQYPIVFMLGKMSFDKGAIHTVEAMQRLWAAGRNVHLVLAGEVLGRFQAYIDGLTAERKKHILVLGVVDDQTKRDLLAAGDILVMPSRTDSFGIVYLEAWAYGKPVIGARTWGVMDVIADGEDGLLVPFGDVDALAAAIRQLLDEPGLASALGSRGRDKALAMHTWDRKYPVVRDLYTRLVEG